MKRDKIKAFVNCRAVSLLWLSPLLLSVSHISPSSRIPWTTVLICPWMILLCSSSAREGSEQNCGFQQNGSFSSILDPLNKSSNTDSGYFTSLLPRQSQLRRWKYKILEETLYHDHVDGTQSWLYSQTVYST